MFFSFFLSFFLFSIFLFFFFLPSTHVIGKGTPHHSGSWSHQGACHSSLQGACYWPESSSPQQNSSQFKTCLKQELFSKLQYNINTWNTGSFVHVVQCTLICCQGDELIRLKSYCSIHAKKVGVGGRNTKNLLLWIQKNLAWQLVHKALSGSFLPTPLSSGPVHCSLLPSL